MVGYRVFHLLLQGCRSSVRWPFYHHEANMRRPSSRMSNRSPRMQKRPMSMEQRKKAHRALPVMIGRVVAVDVTGFDFEETDCNGVVKARYRLMRTALNPTREEELLVSGEIVTMYYTRLKMGGLSLLKFESRRNT